MCVALATFENKIASLFESSNKFILIKSQSNKIQKSKAIPINNNSMNELIYLLKQNNVKVLICGAISGCNRRLLNAQNIKVIPWVTGDVNSIIRAYQSGMLFSSPYFMPGCKGRRGQGRGQFGKGKNRNN